MPSFPPERRGWALGIYGGITGIAVLAGPVIGGAVTQGLAWQWIFWLNVPIGLAAIPFVLRRIEESYGPRARLDVTGLALVTAAAFGIVWGLMRGNTAGWGSLEVVGSLAAGVILTAVFVAFELRTREPMLPMRLFSSRSFSAGNAANFLLSCALFGAVFFMAQFQQVTLGQGPLDAGLRLLPWTATLFVVAPIAGHARRPDRQPAAGRAGADAAGGRLRLDRADRQERPGVLGDDRPDDGRRGRDLDVDSQGPRTRS